MNRSIILSAVVLLVVALSFSSCQDGICTGKGSIVEKTIDVSSFNGIRIPGRGNVHFKTGATQAVTVRSEQNVLDALDFQVTGEKLIVDIDGCFLNYSLDIYITLPRPLSEVLVTGSANVTNEGVLTTTDDLVLDVSGSGVITMNVDATRVSSTVSGSGNINLSGTAQSHLVDFSGTGDLKAFDFATTNTTIAMAGSSVCEVRVDSGLLHVTITGSGKVYYKGTPGSINTKITGSGSLIDGN